MEPEIDTPDRVYEKKSLFFRFKFFYFIFENRQEDARNYWHFYEKEAKKRNFWSFSGPS